MTQLPGYKIYIFLGSECEQQHLPFRGRPLDPRAYYVGDEPCRDVIAGPFLSERHALCEAEAMTDTSGT